LPMRPPSQLLGTWRFQSLVFGLLYAVDRKDRLKVIKGILIRNLIKLPDEDYVLRTPVGTFHCVDAASAYQFAPNWEVKVKEVIRRYHSGLFVDVGANIGYYSVMAGRQGNRVMAIEPNSRAYACLADNVVQNINADSSETYRAVAWSHDGLVRFTEDDYSDTSRVSTKGNRLVRAVSLDSILHGATPSLIKIDAEGSELQVMQGASKTLQSKRPAVIFESLDVSRLSSSIDYLTGLGYQRFRRLDESNTLAE